jgi:hypothetical protein
MYRIIGADQKEYGPITADQIRQWISEGRVNAQTQMCLEGTQDWKPLGMFPEFGFTTSPLAGNLPSPETGPVSPEEIVTRDYTLDILGCVSRGWELLKNNFGALVLPFLLLIVIAIAAWVIQAILASVSLKGLPFVQQQYLGVPIYLILNAVLLGPVLGGLYYIYLAVMRSQPSDIGSLFMGFKSYFSDLFLGKLVTGIAFSVCMFPYTYLYASRMAPLMERIQQNPKSVSPQEIMPQMLSAISGAAPVFFACMIPVTYLSVNWLFTLPLIVDKQMGFWTAMKTSWKMVHKHWFHVFGLVVLLGLLNVAGACACCIGLFVTVPIGVAAMMFAYEDIFGRKTA